MPSFVLGIDFGTTNSVMAVTREDGVDVLSNDIGNNKTPSVVHIDPLKPWVRQVGEAAQRLEIGDPQHTIRNVKRILGLPPECARQITSVDPIKVVNSADGDAVSIKLSDNVNCSPEEVVAMLLLELKKAAKPQLGEEVSKVSIAVPCFFTAAQRQAITSAANLADLEVAEMVNETTAAAAAYAFDRGYSKTVLMVDVGGGGSCVSVVRVEGNEVTVRASSTRMPGGENFDSAMLEYLKKALIQKQGKGISEQRSLEILRSQWVEAKRKLSQLPETIIQTYLPELKVDFRKVVTRTEFENACESLFQKIINAIKITIERAKVDAEKLDDVVLVGGGSRIPKLRELIETTIGDKLCKALNPDEAVAVGAALIGNGKVLIKQEVLGLFTRIRITCKDSQVDYRKEQDRQWSCCTLLPCTYSNFTCNSSAELEIEQGHTEKSLVSICKMAAPSKLDCINFDRRGQLNISVRNKNKKSIYLRGCIPDGKLQNLREIMQSHVKSALEEVDRVLAKNALEDVLRRVKSDESLQSSPFQSKYEELKDFCLKQLDWLDQNSCANKQEFEEIRVVVETREKTFRDECEQEMCRQKEKTEFESVLRTALVTEVSDNEFQQQASSLKEEWNMELKWLSQNQDTSIEEYLSRKKKVMDALNILTEECRRAVIKKQRDAAETNLRIKIRNILLIANEEHGDDSIDKKFKRELRNLHNSVENWLKKHPAASEEELNIMFNNTEQGLVDAQTDCKRLKDERESERIDSKKKAECKVLEGINLKISEFQIVRDAAVALVSKSEQLLQWLKDNPHEESHRYKEVIDEMKQEFDNLKKKKEAEGARQEIKHKLQNILKEALKSDEPLHTLAKDCVLWLEKNPQATKEKMEKLINDVNDVLRELGNARKSFEDTTAANARANEILGCIVKDLSLKFDESAYQNEDMCVNGSGYCPKEYTVVNMNEPRYTRPVPEAKGPVECNGLLTADGPKPAGSVTLPEAFAVARTHARRLRPDGPDPSAGLAPHNDISVFQCLADAMAVRALQDAAGAGLIALLVCKAAAAGRELVSLAVRFVDESGQPVERLLVVKELGRDGEAANCKHLLVTPFLGLCKRAQLDWREKLLGVCTVGAGAEGKAFIGHMAELNNNKAPQELDCGSVPLDWRFMEKIHKRATTGRSGAAPACQKLSEFFSTIDALRSMFAVGGRWYQSLQEHCRNLQPGDNPWLTYTSSCCFVMAQRTKLPWALMACEQDPALRLLSSAILRQINDKSFIICLETCTMMFKSVGGYDDSLVSSESNPSDLIVSLERAFLFNLPQAFKSVCKSSKMRCDVMDANEISEICEDLGKSTLDDWKMNWGKFVFPLLHAVCDFLQLPQHNKPTTRSYQKNRLPSLPQDLDNFFRYFPERFSSLQAMLCGMPRTQLAKEYPFLFKALLGTLTSPLLPPRGKRAQQQLRDSVFYAAGLPALVGPTIIIMSMSDLCHEDKALNLIWEEGRKTLNGKR